MIQPKRIRPERLEQMEPVAVAVEGLEMLLRRLKFCGQDWPEVQGL
jgi:hypothetical protein